MRSGLALEIPHFLVEFVEIRTDQLLLIVDSLANEEYLLLHRRRLFLSQSA